MLLPTLSHLANAGPSVILGLALLIPQTVAQEPTAVVNVLFDPAYRVGSPCLQSCLWYNGGFGRGGDDPDFKDLGVGIGCGRYARNDCYCNPDKAASATKFISSFINNCQTTSTADVSRALGIYGRYCKVVNAQAAAETTLNTRLSSRGNGPTPANTQPDMSHSTYTGKPDNRKTDTVADPGLSQAARIALGVGLGLGLTVILFLVGIFFCLWRRGRRDSTATIGVVEHTPKQ